MTAYHRSGHLSRTVFSHFLDAHRGPVGKEGLGQQPDHHLAGDGVLSGSIRRGVRASGAIVLGEQGDELAAAAALRYALPRLGARTDGAIGTGDRARRRGIMPRLPL